MTAFDYLKDKLDIVDVISVYVRLKKLGSYWKGPCPFHSETDASFTVSPAKGIFYCFGCCKSGDVISFIAGVENITQFESLDFLVKKFSIKIPESLLNQSSDAENRFEGKNIGFKLWSTLAVWCHEQLLKSCDAINYLESRGFSIEVIKKFNLGYFPSLQRCRNGLVKKMQNSGVLLESIFHYGVFLGTEKSFSSPFQNRIIFPIRDVLGRDIGFGSRVFVSGDDRAKYYNSKESLVFEKKKVLFGLDTAKQSMSKSKSVFLVEGYADCLAMQANGYKNTVATLGTACSAHHLKTLSNYVNLIYVLFDGDRAGQKAALRLAEISWTFDMDIKVVRLPKGEDPASVLYEHKSLDSHIKKSIDVFSFFISTLDDDFFRLGTMGKLKSLKKVLGIIGSFPDKMKRFLLLQKLASLVQIPIAQLSRFSVSPQSSDLSNPSGNNIKSEDSLSGYSIEEAAFFMHLVALEQGLEGFEIGSQLFKVFPKKFLFLFERLQAAGSLKGQSYIDLFNKESSELTIWLKAGTLYFEDHINKSLFDNIIKTLFLKYRKEVLALLRSDIVSVGNVGQDGGVQKKTNRY